VLEMPVVRAEIINTDCPDNFLIWKKEFGNGYEEFRGNNRAR
jgi:hypothetical protein